MKKYDAIIIGFGKGGKTLAADLAGQGKTVAMIEMSKQMYGGTCINVGCIPSKSLVNSSHMAIVKNLETFDEKAAFFAEAMAEKERVVTMLRGKNYAKLADHPNVTVYDGFGSFVTDHVVSIKGEAGEEQIEGEQIFINTGSHSFVPPIPGMKEGGRVMTSDGVLSLRELPKTLVIIGGGYISLEFANFFSNFGSRVVLVQRDDGFIPREDREIAAAVQQVLADKGVEFIFSAETKQLDEDADKVKVTLVTKSGELEIDAETVLIATGRQPNTKGLGLENAGVELTERGAVKVDEHMRTSVPHIYAMGDVVGGLQFTYKSLDDYRIVKAALEGGSYVDKGRNLAYSVFIDPSLSRIGLTYDEATAKGYTNIKEVKLPAAAIPKAHVLRKPVGLLKAVVNLDDGKILGATLFCEESYEVINIVKLAMDMGAPYTVLKNQVYTHPTMSEALNDLFSF